MGKRDVNEAKGAEGFLFARIAGFFAALFLVYGFHIPYLPVWLHSRGLTAAEISTVIAAPLFIRVIATPGAGLLADRLGNYRLVTVGLAWCALALVLVLSRTQGYWPVFAPAVGFLLAMGAMLPLVETIAVSGVRTADLNYGHMRLWGSLSFITANFAGGLIVERLGDGFGIWLIVIAAATTAGAAHLLPPPPPRTASPARAPEHWHKSLPVRLLRSPLFVIFLCAIGCIHGAHATFYTFGALHWQSQGLSATWVGALWAIGVLAEVLLFAFSVPVVRRFGPAELMLGGGAISFVRWSVMGLDPPLVVLVPLQILHAFTYGAAHVGAIHFIARAVPHRGTGSAQAFYSVIAAGLGLGIVGLASGALYAAYGGETYFLPAAVSLLGCAASFALLKRWNGGLLWPEEAEPASADRPTDLPRLG